MKMTPYIAYGKKSFLNRSAYRFDHLMSILSTCLQIFIFWEIYKALYGTNTEVDGITLSMVTTNFILSKGLNAAFSINDYFLPDKVYDGSIALELLRPISFKGRMIAENAGNAVFDLIFKFVPSLLIAVGIMGMEKPAAPEMFVLFLLSTLLGYGILWTLSYLVQVAVFWHFNIWSLVTLKNVLINILSGSMIPLWFMPEWMEGVLKVTPFSSIYFTPVQIYLGQLSYQEILQKCMMQMVWIVIIYLIGNCLWLRGQKKLVVQGG